MAAKNLRNAADLAAVQLALGLANHRPVRLIAVGDSNFQYMPGGARAVARLAGGKIRMVSNAGIAGETAAQIAARFGRDVAPFAPDMVLAQIGTNDGASATAIVPAMRSIIRQARALASNPYVLACATIPAFSAIAAGAATRDALSAMIASEFGSDARVIFVDTYTPLLVGDGSVPNTYFGDVHFTRRGAYRFGEVVLANPKVAAILANVVPPVQASANDPSRQVCANPNFDTGAETSGRAAGWSSSSSGTAAVFSTGTEAGITGKFQRVTIPPGNGFCSLSNTVSTLAARDFGGRRAWASYKLRPVSRPSDVNPVVLFSSGPGLVKDAGAYHYGDAQQGFSTSGGNVILTDLEDGVWYSIYNEFVLDEAPFQAATIFTCTGNSSAATPLVIDVAEVSWGLIDPQPVLREGISASYDDKSGSPGAATINKSSGRAAIAAGASSVVITNSKVASSSVVMIAPEDADATATAIRVSAVSSGAFTVTANAAATAATKFRFAVVN